MNEKKLKFKIIKREEYDYGKRRIIYSVKVVPSLIMRIIHTDIHYSWGFSKELKDNVLKYHKTLRAAKKAIKQFREGFYDTIETEV